MTFERVSGLSAVDGFVRPQRCICCSGEIDIAPDQVASLGLSLRLGLVSDELALICDGCAAHLAAAHDAQLPPTRGRRKSPGAASK